MSENRLKANNPSWRYRLWQVVMYLIIAGWIGGAILYEITDHSVFKWISVVSFAPIVFFFLALFFGFIGSFVIYCFLCLVPNRKKTTFLSYPVELPWWGAIIWLVTTFTFLSQVIPVLLHNVGTKLGIIQGETVQLGSSIDQTTLWGMFTAWVIGERTIANSIVSWLLIAAALGVLSGAGWVVKRLWQLSGRESSFKH